MQVDFIVGSDTYQICAFCLPSVGVTLHLDGLDRVVKVFRDKGWLMADKDLGGSLVSDVRLLLGSDYGHVLPTKSVCFGADEPSCVLESALGILLHGSLKQMLKNADHLQEGSD